ncbi:MAG: hypothetical protein C0484_06990 [Rhodospirillum sp.]|nr:hypothetical protein [Rhodospirillum sp.]
MPAPPANTSGPAPPSSVSLPSPPIRVSSPLAPRISLLRALPVTLVFALEKISTFSTCSLTAVRSIEIQVRI